MVKLVPFAPEHFQLLTEWFATEAEVVRWGGTSLSFPLSAEQLEPMLEEGSSTPPKRLCWMAELDELLVGHAQLGFDWRNGNALLSRVAVAPHARGRGLAGAMLRRVIVEAFSFESIERVELNVYARNTPAIQTYERLGFMGEGIRRSSALVDGERWDTTIMGLLRCEWLHNTRTIDSGP